MSLRMARLLRKWDEEEKRRKRWFETHCARFGLEPTDYGKKFLHDGDTLTVTGIRANTETPRLLAMGYKPDEFFAGDKYPHYSFILNARNVGFIRGAIGEFTMFNDNS